MSVRARGSELAKEIAPVHLLHAKDAPEAAPALGVRALIVDSQRMFAEAIGAAMGDSGYDVVGYALRPEDASRMAGRLAPDVVLIRLSDLGDDAIEVGRTILDERPQARVVLLAPSSDALLVRHAVEMGFHGYVTTDAGIEELVESLRAVARGQTVIPRSALPGMSSRSDDASGPFLAWSSLTGREREILLALTHGHSTREIGRRLYISPNTVRTHVQALLVKLQVHSRLEAVAFAKRHGFLRDA